MKNIHLFINQKINQKMKEIEKSNLTKVTEIKSEKIVKVSNFTECCDNWNKGLHTLTDGIHTLTATGKGYDGTHLYYIAEIDGTEITADSHSLFIKAFGFEKTARREGSGEGSGRKKAITEEDFCSAVRKSLLSLCSVGNRNAYDYHHIIMEQTALAVAEYKASEQAEADRLAGHNARIANAKKRQNEILSELAQATPDTLPALQAELLQLATFIATAV